MKVAEIILQQLGGRRFVAMTGSKNFFTNGNDLCMSLSKNSSKANRLQITLDPDDTYTMRFFRYTAPRLNKKTFEYSDEKITEINRFENVYCDQLQDLFTLETGLLTRF